jgi:hypothetical protein
LNKSLRCARPGEADHEHFSATRVGGALNKRRLECLLVQRQEGKMKLLHRKVALAATLSLLCGFAALARDHNSFNGSWTLLPSRSDFAGQPVVQSGKVTIFDHEGNTSVTREFTYEGGGQTWFYKDNVSSEHNASIHEGKDLKSKTTWDHDRLKITTTQPEGITVETYSIGDDGTMTANVLRPGKPPVELLFERK